MRFIIYAFIIYTISLITSTLLINHMQAQVSEKIEEEIVIVCTPYWVTTGGGLMFIDPCTK